MMRKKRRRRKEMGNSLAALLPLPLPLPLPLSPLPPATSNQRAGPASVARLVEPGRMDALGRRRGGCCSWRYLAGSVRTCKSGPARNRLPVSAANPPPPMFATLLSTCGAGQLARGRRDRKSGPGR